MARRRLSIQPLIDEIDEIMSQIPDVARSARVPEHEVERALNGLAGVKQVLLALCAAPQANTGLFLQFNIPE